MRLRLSALVFALLPLAAAAQTAVSLQGILGNKALLIVNGAPPRAVAPGQTHQDVKVISTGSDQAVVQVDGQRLTLRVGEVPASVGGAAPQGGNSIALTADSRGHFFTSGSINNRPVRFLVDTGASAVGIGQAEADRLGLNYKKGQPIMMNTANGRVTGWMFKLNSVRVGDVVAYEVDAVVTPAAMPAILLGNSFLNRFNMRRDGQHMMLVKR